ncbi:hypothetical protein RhiTH_009136 [Rhizoctonia solani]
MSGLKPEPSLSTLLKAIHTLTTQVGSLQDQVKVQGKQITQLAALCKETNNLVGDKDQGKPSTPAGPSTPPNQQGGQTNTSKMVRP